MLLQKSQIGKTAVILITVLFLVGLAILPNYLQADSTGAGTPDALVYLPYVQQDNNGTPPPSTTPTPTQTATSTATSIPDTPTPIPADLIIGQPIMISTPPITVYKPVSFQIPITNSGEIDINTLFFVDLLFEPPALHFSDVYSAISSLGGNSSITLTITSTIGFANFVGTHQVTGWVDSLDHISEADETNNLSDPLEVIISDFGGTPVSTSTPNGTETISGITRAMLGTDFINIERAAITVIDEVNGTAIASTYSDANGSYSVNNLPSGTTYTVQACIVIDNNEYFGVRFNRTLPDPLADIFMTQSACP